METLDTLRSQLIIARLKDSIDELKEISQALDVAQLTMEDAVRILYKEGGQ